MNTEPIFLEEFYSLVDAGRTSAAIDRLFNYVDSRFLAGRFLEVDRLLDDIDLARLDTRLIVAVLSITLCASPELPNRAAFFEACRERLQVLAPGRLENLLRGLKGPPARFERIL